MELTTNERRLRLLLLDVAKSIDETGKLDEPVTLRWAGGWVRDRLLGIPSHDIDVAINNMTGEPFAMHMQTYCDDLLSKPEAERKHAITREEMGNLYRVASNPAKSKHLETAGFEMFSLELDFVNLRKETYAEDSRNPQMEFGTAEEDARRRDATINALFYNLHTDSVEDFTGGLPDLLERRIIRTPLEPLQTFMDDPLRVLRLVRFSSRLQFAIDPETERHMGDVDVLRALRTKISRERVGIELEKMLKDGHPRYALGLIERLQLYHAIFTDPTKDATPQPEISRWHVACDCLDHLLRTRTPGSIGDKLAHTADASYIAWNLTALCPWMKVEDLPDPNRKANAPPLVTEVARQGFRAPNKLTTVLTASHRHLAEILELKRAVVDREAFITERDRYGMAIRQWEGQTGSWRLQVLNALLVEAMEKLQSWDKNPSQDQVTFLRGWQAFLDHLTELDVWDAPGLKPLLDGRSLASALGIKPGKWTGAALNVCTAWQLRNPGEKDPAGAIEEVRSRAQELEIPLKS